MLDFLPDGPLIEFTILLLVSLTIPPIFERLRLPGLVGLLVAGIILGDNGLQLLSPDSETIDLLSDVGKIYLMFVAGLEIDLAEFRKTKNRSMGFGFATFAFPIITGTLVGQLFGFDWVASVLIGSLIASHTLLGFPIVNRLGISSNEPITVTVGATIFTDIAALLVLAICIAIDAGEFSPLMLALQLGALALYAVLILFGVDWAGKAYFRRTGDEESNQFLFVLLVLFLAAVGAQLINVDQIVGAFLVGLAVNDVVGHSPVEEKVEFVGSTLFIPFFFVGMGLLLDVPVFIETVTQNFAFPLIMIGGLFVSKFLASYISKLLYGYSWDETLTMWSLSLPQVAATLAAALAGVNAGIIPQEVFNTVIVLMLVTSIIGPTLTERFGRNLPLTTTGLETGGDWQWWEQVEASSEKEHTPNLEQRQAQEFTVVVPIYNPLTERYLIEMAALLANHEAGKIVPLVITKAHVHMDEPDLSISLRESEQLLEKAAAYSQEFKVKATPLLRIDDDIAEGITRTAREQDSSLILMGWSESVTGLRSRLFGSLIDNVIWSSHCPVVITRLLDEPINLHRILVPVKNLSVTAVRAIRFAQLFADTHQASVTYLHVCDPRTDKEQIQIFEQEIRQVLEQPELNVSYRIKTVPHDKTAKVLLRASRSFDLIVLRSLRRRTAGGLAVSDVTTEVMDSLACSFILFGEPHS
ncbi:sodium:proton antiporter [Euhalothece natronophila Z-M001]|uniref:Sodium:proton antiporter n=1 Tax=Euhalothece natronophila Z-M001 TaxID=522448 RepID=A0A5B8NKH0_9CHRO|nr:cation:proton antiporter [Euhalothece natronophila]QDZ38599.1 sodium:proton antiporter [Euhalothece natronophila Z-M001]